MPDSTFNLWYYQSILIACSTWSFLNWNHLESNFCRCEMCVRHNVYVMRSCDGCAKIFQFLLLDLHLTFVLSDIACEIFCVIGTGMRTYALSTLDLKCNLLFSIDGFITCILSTEAYIYIYIARKNNLISSILPYKPYC